MRRVLSPRSASIRRVTTQAPVQWRRHELGERLRSEMAGLPDGGYGTPLVALEKTNHKYEKAAEWGFGEDDEAERVAAGGMAAMVQANPDTLHDTSLAAHYNAQRMDAEFHRSVTARNPNPYGAGTTALTNLAPIWMRALYSYGTSRVPRFSDRT